MKIYILTKSIRNNNTNKICMDAYERLSLAFQWPRSVRQRPEAQAVGLSVYWDFQEEWTCAWPYTVATHPVIQLDRPFQSAQAHSSIIRKIPCKNNALALVKYTWWNFFYILRYYWYFVSYKSSVLPGIIKSGKIYARRNDKYIDDGEIRLIVI